jgi:hypothetical protein
MEANMKHRVKKHVLRLQDLVRIVSQYSRNDREMSLVVADLFNRGLARVHTHRNDYRAVVR